MGRYNPEYHREYYLRNKEEKKKQSKKWKADNPDRVKEYYQRTRRRYNNMRLTQNFGISIDEYEELLSTQKGVCVICRKPEKGKALAVDHCHKCGEVRGLLCQMCNRSLGQMDDDIERLQQAIKYLQGYVCGDNSNTKNNQT